MNVIIKNYKIIRELGRGGMGAVYLAYDNRLDRQVAIKILQIDASLDEANSSEIIQRFQKEAKAIAKLNHPNIVSIYDIGEENQQYYMVIELLEGQSLSNIVEKKQKLSKDVVIDIGVQICSALSYAHKNGIVHRDIKPANIMFSKERIAKLTDFGIAQLGNDKMGLTHAGSILGSILYIPPEQLVDSRKVDQRADIYSFGVTLFQLFTGRLPFEGESVAEVITKILNQDVPSMRLFDPTIPEVLDKVVLKAMKKEPKERFSEVGDLGSALSEIGKYLKDFNYKLDPVIFNEFEKNVTKPKTDILVKTEKVKIPANSGDNGSAKNSAIKYEAETKKNVTPQKISTVPLNKNISSKSSSKSKAFPLITLGLIVGVISLFVILISIFGGKKTEDNKPVTPVYTQTDSKKIIKTRPVIKPFVRKIQKSPQVIKPKFISAKKAEIRNVVKKPLIQISKPVLVRRPTAKVIKKKLAVTKKQATITKKSIGEGY